MRRILRSAALIIALTGAVVVGAAGTASASGSTCSDFMCSTYVAFDSYGEHFTVIDSAADGHSAVGVFETWTGSSWRVYDVVWASGYNTQTNRNYSLPERLSVRYHACVGERGSNVVLYCGGWYYDVA